MKQLQGMPDIWDDQTFLTSRNEILGELANWAVKQSPYIMPDYLEKGLIEFCRTFDNASFDLLTAGAFFASNCNSLRLKIRETFEKCPTIMGWNVSKEGNSQIVTCSRCHAPDPDYNFIDLDALARNIAHSITLEAKYYN